MLVKEKDEMRGKITSLPESPFIFDDLILAAEKRKEEIVNIRILYCNEIEKDVKDLINSLKEKGIDVTNILEQEQQQ